MTDGAMGSTIRLAHAPGRIGRSLAALLLLSMQLAGCYTTRPVAGMPEPGTTLILEISDRGRVELADRVGQSVEWIRGETRTASDSAYVVQVQSVRYLNGQITDWSGEQITVPASFVSRVRQRERSISRSLLLTGAVVAALVVLLVQVDLLGGGSDNDRGNPDPEPNPGS